MKRLFCKHRWVIMVASVDPSYEMANNSDCGVRVNAKIGVSVYCSKCLKEHKRLTKQMSKIYAQSYIDNFKSQVDETFRDEFKRLYKGEI